MVLEDATTKVYYHLDDSTPYMSVIPVSAKQITLGDFKKIFGRRGYSYFCKEFDRDLKREVKVEIISDSQRLQKSANGLIELFLLSSQNHPNNNTNHLNNASIFPIASSSGLYSGNSGTLPRTFNKKTTNQMNMDSGFRRLEKRRSSVHALSSIVDEMDVGGGQRVSMVTNNCRSVSGEASSDINTLISKRAGEQLAELYTSASEDPYKFDGISDPLFNNNNYRLNPNNYKNINNNDSSLNNNSSSYYEESSPRTFSTHNNIRQRRPRKQRYRKAYVPSTISSASESSLSFSLPRVDEIQIRLQDAPCLGITVACQDGGIFIGHIAAGSAADKCGQLEIGDQIVQIEHTSFENLSDKQAVEVIKKIALLKRTITIYVAKRPRMSDQRSGDALSLLCETMQLDVSQWVEATKQENVEPLNPFLDIELDTSSSKTNENNNKFVGSHKPHRALEGSTQQQNPPPAESVGGVTSSDEERAAYADRRNGVGARLVPALQQKHPNKKNKPIPQQNEAPSSQNIHLQHMNAPQTNIQAGAPQSPQKQQPRYTNETDFNGFKPLDNLNMENFICETIPLNTSMDPLIILKQMARPDSNLEIKDRTWLKIPVPNSFIGNEMIDWLMDNVNGFINRKSARNYASVLLTRGLIKHVVNVSNFNEKCYYIFEDSIIAERHRLLKQQYFNRFTTANNNNNTNHLLGGAAATISGSTLKSGGLNNGAETNTDITYMSNPSSSPPFMMPPANTNNGCTTTSNHTSKLATNNNNNAIVMASNPRYVSAPQQTSSSSAKPPQLGTSKIPQRNNNQSVQLNNNTRHPNNNNNLLNVTSAINNNTTWPISPIYAPNNNNNHLIFNGTARLDCESPTVTNDYASMIQGEINSGAQFEMSETPTLKLKENHPILISHQQQNLSKIPPAPQRSAPLLPPIFKMN